jgi:P4 family phage/plasmid primase-like protien
MTKNSSGTRDPISIDSADRMLSYVRGVDDRDTWVRVGCALKDEFGDIAFDIWDQWSQSAQTYQANAARDVWKSIKGGGGSRITIGTLVAMAREGGWTPSEQDRKPVDPQEIVRIAEARAARLQAEREQEAADRAVAAEKAAKMWAAATDATERGHEYLTRKQVAGIGARVMRDMLLIPLRHGPGALVGLQIIKPDGSKKFLTGTPKAGAYTVLGKPSRIGPVIICEGWATGASIHMATGWCVVVAFDAGNLDAVARKIRAALPDAAITIAADDDAWTAGNPGITSANTAARAIAGTVATPRWAGDRGEGATDFNDLHAAEGLDAVRVCFDDPQEPGPAGRPETGSGAPERTPGATPSARVKPASDPAPSTGANNAGSSAGLSPFLSGAAVHHEPLPPVILPGGGSDVYEVDTTHDEGVVFHHPPSAPTRHASDEPHRIFSSTPMKTAELFHAELPEGGSIIHWRGEFYSWDGVRYAVRDKIWIEQRLYHFMAACETIKTNPKTGDQEVVAFNPKTNLVNDVAHALRAVCYADLPEPQVWIEPRPGDFPAHEIIAFANGFLHWPTRTIMPSTDRLFVTNALEFDYNPNADEPKHWTSFLHALWPTDPESISGIGEMFGYLLTDDTSQQKMFMLIGPPRCGKGTILRVLEALVGYPNRVSPSLASLGTQFGLQPLIGKRLAMISDARLSGRADQQPIVESLLRISGEDAVSIDRKNIQAWTGKLPTRFVLASNELPAFSDASSALANRFLPFKFNTSFLGREDMGLTSRLLKELPGIVLWALDGLQRLQARGYLQRPTSADELAADLVDQTSPIRSFVEECCIVGAGHMADRDEMFRAWKKWCEAQGRDHAGTKVGFGRQLSAAFPDIARAQPREGGTRLNLYSGVRLCHDFEKRDAPY